MQSIQRTPEEVPAPVSGVDPTPAEVKTTLDSILQSQPFRTSRQCQNLLSYIVEHSLHDDDSSLRERILGIEVFGRSPDYDTSEDPVVRMRAADVRKRLAQFYQANGHEAPVVHITLKPGSYRATFHSEHEIKPDHHQETVLGAAGTPEADVHLLAPDVIDTTASHNSAPPATRHLRLRTLLIGSLVVFLLGVAAWRVWVAHSTTAQQRFWAPLTRPNQPVLVYVGSNAVYRFTPEFMQKYQKEHGLKVNGPEFFVDLPKGSTLHADDLMAEKDCFVSVADLAAAVQVVSLMHTWSKPYTLRSAADLTIGDIRNVPAVLIGGFNNQWVLETTNGLPFSFRDGIKIENRKDPAHSWVVVPEQGVSSTEDFALISRIQHSNTGGPVITIGGIGSFGTQAAAEFVANPEKMNDLLKSAPAGWENKNMQAVLRIKVVDLAPVAIDVVATSYW
jgi:hypothetical protein